MATIQDVLSSPTPPEGAQLDIPLEGLRLSDVANNPRFYELDTAETYYRGKQDNGKMYDWDGNMMGYGGQADIKPGWYVPMKRRKPCARYDLGKLIVTRLTSMVFGSERFPVLRMEGDPDAQDYVKALCDASHLPTRMIEARNLGGAMGTACLSFCFKNGQPRVEVHNAKHCTVLRWDDEDERIVGAVLKTYAYPRQVFDPDSGKLKTVTYYYARYWDKTHEILWQPIEQERADTQQWQNLPHKAVEHNFGFCPFYWVQNLPDSQEPDGEGDFEGLEPNFDEINQIFSADAKGVKANCDPTLVVKMDPNMNEGTVQKGTGEAIFSPNGAQYLTLGGEATAAAESTMEKLRSYSLDVAGVVLTDPEKMSGSAQSAQAMRIIYAPMLAKCDLLREQYGDMGLRRILLGMLEASRKLSSGVTDIATGEAKRLAINLPPRAVKGDGDEVTFTERKPGTSTALELNWMPYFQPTWADVQSASEAVKIANGEKPVISHRTSVEAVATIFGVTDVDAEVAQIEEEKQQAIEEAREAMEMSMDDGGENAFGDQPKPKDPGGAGGGKAETTEARQKGKEEKAT